MKRGRFVEMAGEEQENPNLGETGGEQPSTNLSKAGSPTKTPVEKDVGKQSESNDNDDGGGDDEFDASDSANAASAALGRLTLDNQKANLAQLRELTKAACKVTSRKEFHEILVDWIVTFDACVEECNLLLALNAARTASTKLHAAAFRVLLRRVQAGEELSPETIATEWGQMCGFAAPLHSEVAAWVPLVVNGTLRLAVEQRRALLMLRYQQPMVEAYVCESVQSTVFAVYPHLRTERTLSDVNVLIKEADVVYNSAPLAPAVAATTVARRGAFDVQRGRGGGRGGGSGRGGRGSEWQGRCYRCGQAGHFARQCPTPPTTVAATNVAPAADSVAKSGSMKAAGSQYASLVGVVRASVSTSPLCVPVSVRSSWRAPLCAAVMCVDTGAVPALIAPTLCDRAGLKVMPSTVSHVAGVGGELLAVAGEANLRVTLGGKSRAFTALVVKSAFELLVGMEFMHRFDVGIEISSDRATVSMAGGDWVSATEFQSSPIPVLSVSESASTVALITGCEKLIADGMREQRSGQRGEPWELPPLGDVEQADIGDVVIGEPALRGADLHAIDLIHYGPDLSAGGAAKLRAIAERYSHCFGGSRADGAADTPPLSKLPALKLVLKPGAEHEIDRVRAHEGRISREDTQIITQFVEQALADNVIEEAPNAPCSSRAFVVNSGGKKRVVINFHALDRLLFNNVGHVPRTGDIQQMMAAADYPLRSKFDFFGLYPSCALEKDSRPLTATLFLTTRGAKLYQFKRVPLGVSPAPGAIHPLMARLFESSENIRIFFDDGSFRSRDEDELAEQFEAVLRRAEEYGLTLSAGKVYLGFGELPILGKCVGPGYIKPTEEFLDGLREFAPPVDIRGLQQFLGVCNVLAPHSPSMRGLLTELEALRGQRGRIEWTHSLRVAFENAKLVLLSPEVVVPVDEARELLIITDASGVGGAIIFAYLASDEERLELVDVLSYKFTPAEREQPTAVRELAMLVRAWQKAPHLCMGHASVTWVTDSATMRDAVTSPKPSSSAKVQRLLAKLAGARVHVMHVPGMANHLADMLSRNPAWLSESEHSPPPELKAPVDAPIAAPVSAMPLEDGEVAGDDDEALAVFGDDSDEVEEEIVLAEGRVAHHEPEPAVGRVPMAPAGAPAAAESDGVNLQFDLWRSGDRELEREVLLEKQHGDEFLKPFWAEGERRAKLRAEGELDDDGAIPEGASSVAEFRPEIAPDGMLYVRVRDEQFWRLVVPNGCRDQVLRALHGDGHWHARRMLVTASRFFWWHGMYSDAVRYCKQCVACQRVRLERQVGNLGDSESEGVPVRFESLSMDSVEIESRKFLTIVELFSGLLLMLPLASATSLAAAEAFEAGYLASFGAPRAIHSDGGPEFKGDFAACCAAWGIELKAGLPYNPQSVARVARAQRTVQDIVAKLRAEGSLAPVSTLVAKAVTACNMAPRDDASHASPQQLLFAHAAPIPVTSFVDPQLAGLRPTSPVASLARQLQDMRKQFDAQAAVRAEQRAHARQRSEEAYARGRAEPLAPQPGDWLWAQLPRDDEGSKQEMKLKWSGPWEVVRFDPLHQRVDMRYAAVASELSKLTNVSVHARRVRPYTRVRPIDDVADVDGSGVPLAWETMAAPLGGLSQQPAGVQRILRKAEQVAAQHAHAAAKARERQEKKELDEAAARAAAQERERVTAAAAARRVEEERLARAAAERQREQAAATKSLINKVLSVHTNSEGVKIVTVERVDGSRTDIQRDDRVFAQGTVRAIVQDFENRQRAQRAGQRMNRRRG